MAKWRKYLKFEYGDLAFGAVSFAALAITFLTEWGESPWYVLAAVVVLLVMMTLIGTRVLDFVEDIHNTRAVLAYYFVQTVLFCIVLPLSDGGTIIMILPLIAQSVSIFDKWKWIIGISAFYMALLIVMLIILGASVPLLSQTVLSILSGIVFVIIFTRIAFQAERNRVEIQRLAIELQEANHRLREYAAQAEELATTKERNRVAREIHDTLGHYLTVINMQLEAARVLFGSDESRPKTLEALNKAQTLTKEGLAEVRQSVGALRASPVENKSLPEAIGQLVSESQAAGIVTELHVKGVVRSLTSPVELTLYRVAQEGLTNVRKHSLASRAEVFLDYSYLDKVCLTVQDNGVGVKENPNGSGFGLLGMQERVQLLNGVLRRESLPNQGFKLYVEIPTPT
jgi:signal transduction histidine kinase